MFGKKLSPRDIEKVLGEGMKECIEFIGTFKGQNGEVEIPTSLRNKERANTSSSIKESTGIGGGSSSGLSKLILTCRGASNFEGCKLLFSPTQKRKGRSYLTGEMSWKML
ncbi:hypothetical protein [Pyrococcus kukulkanii]|uniref:hypothetical protein n=1 Tax=Pyrococcus kukulkanii TaxID=1609559 RepID=UPI003569601C